MLLSVAPTLYVGEDCCMYVCMDGYILVDNSPLWRLLVLVYLVHIITILSVVFEPKTD